jgi:hypothetical protein
MQYLTDNSDRVMQRGDEISDCEIYRYWLWREWDRTGPTLAFLMLNPVTADNLSDNLAIARRMARAVAEKYGRLEIANILPLRATDPGELLMHADPLGPRNAADGAVLDTIERVHMVICAWGAHPAAAPGVAGVMHLAQ